MKLVLNSGTNPDKTEVDKYFIQKFFNNKSFSIGYIPSCTDKNRKYYKQTQEWYSQFGRIYLNYFDLDLEYDEKEITKLLKNDAIYLSGGNTYYFLHSIKKHNFIPILKDYVSNGGVLIGYSAGSLIMCPDIEICSIDYDLDGDSNDIGLKDLSAINLVNFYIYPHYDKNEIITKRLKKYSQKIKNTIYAYNDGDGIVVEDNDIKLFGDVIKFSY